MAAVVVRGPSRRHTAVSTRQSSGVRWRMALVSNFMLAVVSFVGSSEQVWFFSVYCCKYVYRESCAALRTGSPVFRALCKTERLLSEIFEIPKLYVVFLAISDLTSSPSKISQRGHGVKLGGLSYQD